MEKEIIIKTVKGFDENLQCLNFQYEVGKEYSLPKGESAELCKKGFHAVNIDKSPLSVFDYYEPSIYGRKSRYCEVEFFGNTKSVGNKMVGSRIKIGAEIGISGLIKAHFEWVKRHIKNENNAEEGQPAMAGDSGAATAGDYGAATAGYRGAATAGDSGAATAGDYGAATAGNRGAATAGYSGAATAGNSGAATAGNRGAATAGNRGAATAGYRGAATAGNRGAATAGDSGAATAGNSGAATAGNHGAATAGDSGAATSRGSVSVGVNGVGCVRGEGVKARGGLGAILMIAIEKECNYDLKEWKTVVVDGDAIKADTWYTLEDGELIELSNEE